MTIRRKSIIKKKEKRNNSNKFTEVSDLQAFVEFVK